VRYVTILPKSCVVTFGAVITTYRPRSGQDRVTRMWHRKEHWLEYSKLRKLHVECTLDHFVDGDSLVM